MSLEVTNLEKSFGHGEKAVTVLEDLSFTVEPGELVALAGKKRSGKTVLLNILAGIDRPTSGEVTIDDVPVTRGTFFRLGKHRSRRVGIITKEPMLIPELSVAENVALPLEHRFLSGKAKRKMARNALRTVGMREKANLYPNALTPFEQQLVCTARAIVHSPKYVLCDEPTACMESFEVEKYMEVLEVIAAASGCAVLVATYTRRVASLCRRIIPVTGYAAERSDSEPRPMDGIPNHTIAGGEPETLEYAEPVEETPVETVEKSPAPEDFSVNISKEIENVEENVKFDDIDVDFETALKNNINNML